MSSPAAWRLRKLPSSCERSAASRSRGSQRALRYDRPAGGTAAGEDLAAAERASNGAGQRLPSSDSCWQEGRRGRPLKRGPHRPASGTEGRGEAWQRSMAGAHRAAQPDARNCHLHSGVALSPLQPLRAHHASCRRPPRHCRPRRGVCPGSSRHQQHPPLRRQGGPGKEQRVDLACYPAVARWPLALKSGMLAKGPEAPVQLGRKGKLDNRLRSGLCGCGQSGCAGACLPSPEAGQHPTPA